MPTWFVFSLVNIQQYEYNDNYDHCCRQDQKKSYCGLIILADENRTVILFSFLVNMMMMLTMITNKLMTRTIIMIITVMTMMLELKHDMTFVAFRLHWFHRNLAENSQSLIVRPTPLFFSPQNTEIKIQKQIWLQIEIQSKIYSKIWI